MDDQEPSIPASKPRLRLHKKLLFAGVFLVGALLVGELVARVVGPDSRVVYTFTVQQGLQLDQEKDLLRNPLPDVPYLLAPHANFSQRWPSNPRGYFDEPTSSLTYPVNEAGFRGDDFPDARSGAVRIALLGDSFCWGLGVRDQDLFVVRLGRALQGSGLFDGRFEILNFGLGGYNTKGEVALFEHVVLPYQPDVAVIWFFLNDWEYGAQTAVTNRYLIGNNILQKPRRYSRLLDWIATPIDAHLGKQRLVRTFNKAFEADSTATQVLSAALRRFAAICQDYGIVPVLAIHPVLIDLDKDYPFAVVHQKVTELARRAGIHVVDLFAAFEGYSASKLWVHSLDKHPNEIAHRLVADYFFERLTPILQANEQTIRRHVAEAAQ
ncbi:MAG: SGNH/GDSL hydrolase family protein [Phycisphaerales bacterium]|nr:MAG: SGNH/GDSL hydrolase family protein [Phycisphaerales bacterium]